MELISIYLFAATPITLFLVVRGFATSISTTDTSYMRSFLTTAWFQYSRSLKCPLHNDSYALRMGWAQYIYYNIAFIYLCSKDHLLQDHCSEGGTKHMFHTQLFLHTENRSICHGSCKALNF